MTMTNYFTSKQVKDKCSPAFLKLMLCLGLLLSFVQLKAESSNTSSILCVLECSDDLMVNTDVGVCGAIINGINPLVSGDCPGTTVLQTSELGNDNLFPVGITTVSYSASYLEGDIDVCSFTITVIDNQVPVLECSSDLTVDTDLNTCGAIINGINPNVIENCPGTTVLQTSDFGNDDLFPLGTTTVSYSATDAVGNQDVCSFTITVIDNQVPVAVCPTQAIIVNLDEEGNANLPANALIGNSTDNCISFTESSPQVDFDCDSESIEIVLLTVQDAAGNTSTEACNITINNSSALVTCYRDIDGDNYGDPADSQEFCGTCGDGYVIDIANCDNLTDGGTIGDDEVLCDNNFTATTITSIEDVSGGSGTIEYLWMQNTVSGTPPVQNLANWVEIPNSNAPTYTPGTLSQTTWFIRCARRSACTYYTGESNVIKKTVQENCAPPYCEVTGLSTEYEWIQRVQINTIDNNSGDDGGYGDYTDMTTTVTPGHYAHFYGQPGYSGYKEREYWSAWADWNQDGDFNDWGELLFDKRRRGAFHKYFYVPSYAHAGQTRMRVVMSYSGWAWPCEDISYGEFEDYTLEVSGSNFTGGGDNRTVNNEQSDPDITFHAEKGKESTNLWWLKTGEERVASYVLEHSTNERDWTEIYSTTETERGLEKNYSYLHDSPTSGDNYYRIRTEYLNGEMLYTEMRTVNFIEQLTYRLYPNPADNYFNIDLSELAGEDVIISIYDNLGQERLQMSIEDVNQRTVRIDLKKFIDGIYFVQIGSANRRQVTKTLTINRLYGWTPDLR